MPGAAVIGAALQSTTHGNMAIWVGGLDVANQPGATGNGYGSQAPGIRIVEEGPGGVSSATVVVDDPGRLVNVAESAPVVIHDLTRDVVEFRGEVDNVASSPAYGGQGRRITIGCIGIEAWLDRNKLPVAFTAPIATNLTAAIQQLLASQSFVAVRAGFSNLPNGGDGTPDGELSIGDLGVDFIGTGEAFPFLAAAAVTVPAGRSLRQAIAALVEGSTYDPIGLPRQPADVLTTIDMQGRLRVWLNRAGQAPADYMELNVIDDVGFAEPAAAGLAREDEYGDRVRELYIAGGTADASGWFSDGSGLRSDQARIEDATLTTLVAAQARAAAYFAEQAAVHRSTLSIEDYEPGDPIRAGALLNLTDVATGATGTYRIAQIDKSWNRSGTQNWTLTAGAFAPSSARLLGQIAREV